MKGPLLMKRSLTVLGFIFLFAGVCQANTQPVVSNVIATQRPHSPVVDVTYDIADADGDMVFVSLWYSIDGGFTWDQECTSASGDVGAGVVPSVGLSAIWDASVDLPDYINTDFAIRVYADDGSEAVPEGFVLIPPGTFQMGSPSDEPGRWADREALHPVTLTRGFFMAQTEVTEARWDEVMGTGSSTSQLPKEGLTWDDAILYCNQLSLIEGLTPAYSINGPDGDATWNSGANGYRLPTEAEWEYACRAGSQTAFYNGPITVTGACIPDTNLDLVGWHCGNSGGVAHEVGQKSPNAWGLYDMHGNLQEWVWDGHRLDYENLSSVDPVYNVGSGELRVLRGGVYSQPPRSSRSASRFNFYPLIVNAFGVRPVRWAN